MPAIVPDKIQFSIVSKCSPFRVDEHVLLPHEVGLVDGMDVLDLLQVAGVGASPKDQADPTPGFCPGTAHEAAWNRSFTVDINTYYTKKSSVFIINMIIT